jgi:hypothetical protein
VLVVVMSGKFNKKQASKALANFEIVFAFAAPKFKATAYATAAMVLITAKRLV